jgi:flagellar protein FlaG
MSIQLVAAIQGSPPTPAIGQHPSDRTNVSAPHIAAEKPNEFDEPSDKQLEDALDTLSKAAKSMTDALDFSIDENSGRTVVKVIDKSTNEVIRQFPSKEALEIARSLNKLQGLLIKETA